MVRLPRWQYLGICLSDLNVLQIYLSKYIEKRSYTMEKHLDFEKRMVSIHKPNRVNAEALKTLQGTHITDEWKITYPAGAGIVLQNVVV